MIDTLNYVTLGLGLAALFFTGCMAIFFWTHRNHRLGVAIYLNMLAEMVAGGMTALFSFEAVVDWWTLTAVQAITFRNLIFSALFISSVHLAWQARKVLLEGKQNNATRSDTG